ncbi:hypothetical protein LguiA_036122 [Lonicera macranthoides]
MCRWKPQAIAKADAATALITLRKRLDNLTEMDDPYKEHRATRPFLEISYFCGLLVCFDVAEPYYPDRILREFGRVQIILMMPIVKPSKSTIGKKIQSFNVQVEVKKVISMIYEAFHDDEADDISIVALNAYDIFLNAMKATAPEKAQEHDPNVTPSGTTKLLAKEKAQEHDPNATPSGTTKLLAKEKGNTYVTRRRKN